MFLVILLKENYVWPAKKHFSRALTYNYVKVMRESKNKLSRQDVIAKLRKLMRDSFRQTPQLEGNASNRVSAIAY